MCREGYITEQNGHAYCLHPIYSITHGRLRVIEAEMHKEPHEFVGTWPRAQMPLQLIWDLERWGKFNALFSEDRTTNARWGRRK